MNTIKFSPDFEIHAGVWGVAEQQSGMAGHNPDQVACLFRNVTYSHRLTDAEEQRVKDAAARGEGALRQVLESIFTPVGRAAQGRWL